MADREKILERIMKLLEMTTARGCTIEEAAVALRKVQQLLFEYNISEADINEHRQQETIIEMVMDPKIENNRLFDWVLPLCWAISRTTSCEVLIVDHRDLGRKLVVWIGLPLDIDTSVKIFEYAVYQAKAKLHSDGIQASMWARTNYFQFTVQHDAYGRAFLGIQTPFVTTTPGEITEKQEDSFLLGFAEGIAFEIKKREEADREQPTDQTSMMLAICDEKLERNKEHTAKVLAKNNKESSPYQQEAKENSLDPDAYKHGVRTGQQTELSLKKELGT